MNQQNLGHPAWEEILSVIPESLHAVVSPKLKAWDEGVRAKIEEVNSSVESLKPFQELLDNQVNMDQVRQGLGMLYQANEDPTRLINDINEYHKLGYVDKDKFEELNTQLEQVQQNPDANANLWEDGQMDLSKDPTFQAMVKQLETVNSELNSFKTDREKREQQSQVDAELAELKASKGDYDETVVLSLMASGLSGEQAVDRYHEIVNQAAASLAGNNGTGQETPAAASTDAAPVVMGADGVAGSGLHEQAIDFGSMPEAQLKQSVVEILKANANS